VETSRETTKEPAPRRGRALRVVLVALALAAALAGALLLGGASLFTWRLPPISSSHIDVAPTPNVLLSVQQLHRLEGASFHMERVIELTDEQTKLFGLIDAKDAILLVAVGDVVAGVDLDGVTQSDLDVDWPSRRAHLRLPSPQIFAVTIDNEKTHVVSRRTDMLATRREDLEGKARVEAESSMRQAAIDAGVIDHAKTGAEQSVTTLLRGLGFTDVSIDWK
jgi:hypothetical protein